VGHGVLHVEGRSTSGSDDGEFDAGRELFSGGVHVQRVGVAQRLGRRRLKALPQAPDAVVWLAIWCPTLSDGGEQG
jgi:hypothetical protein